VNAIIKKKKKMKGGGEVFLQDWKLEGFPVVINVVVSSQESRQDSNCKLGNPHQPRLPLAGYLSLITAEKSCSILKYCYSPLFS